MNLPNRLTLARLALTAVFVVAMSIHFPGSHMLALGVFLAASLTDYLDGALARRRGLVTDFGKLMDPLADKILTAAAFILLVTSGAIPAWVVITIISREFLITGLRTLANSQGVVLPAERLGKHKTAWQMVTIVYFLALLAASEFIAGGDPLPAWFHNAWIYGGGLLVAVTTILTVYSGAAYLWRHRDLIATR